MDLSTIDLTALVERDGVALRPVAGEFHGPCPACGGRDRFCVWTHGDRQMYRCRKCHPRPADAVAYLRWRHGMSFAEACAALRVQPDRSAQPVVSVPPPYVPVDERPEIWRTAIGAFVDSCATALWQPEAAAVRRYLAERGLTTDTLRRYRVGYHAPAGGTRGAKIAGRWWAWRGITIPRVYACDLWAVNVRRQRSDIAADGGAGKYKLVTGSTPRQLWNGDALISFLVGNG